MTSELKLDKIILLCYTLITKLRGEIKMKEIIGMAVLAFITFVFTIWMLKKLYEYDYCAKSWDNERY